MHQRMCHVSYLWEWLIISKYILEKEKGKGKPTGGSAEPDGPEPEPDGRGSARPAEKVDVGQGRRPPRCRSREHEPNSTLETPNKSSFLLQEKLAVLTRSRFITAYHISRERREGEREQFVPKEIIKGIESILN